MHFIRLHTHQQCTRMKTDTIKASYLTGESHCVALDSGVPQNKELQLIATLDEGYITKLFFSTAPSLRSLSILSAQCIGQ